jgi:hypothetical protein
MTKFKIRTKAMLGIFCMALGTEGCGPLRPMPLPLKNMSPLKSDDVEGDIDIRASLNLKVEPSGCLGFNSKLINRELSRLIESVTANDKQIVFGRPFPNRGHGLYFVWSRDSMGSEVLSGAVTYRIWNATNHWTSDLVTVPIRFNSIQNRWFVSVFDLLRQRSSDSPPDPASETHVFILELGLSNQRTKVIEIRFRIRE